MVALSLQAAPQGAGHAARYQAQESSQTLAEALEEYYGRNQGRVARPETLPDASRDLFRCHDLCHVIFGLDTTLGDEVMADTRTLFSSDVGWRRYSRYLDDPQARAIFAELGWATAVWVTLRSIPRILRAAIAGARMRQKWPWEPPPAFLSRSLADLRREYGIKVF
jgi:hypothetical protein